MKTKQKTLKLLSPQTPERLELGRINPERTQTLALRVRRIPLAPTDCSDIRLRKQHFTKE